MQAIGKVRKAGGPDNPAATHPHADDLVRMLENVSKVYKIQLGEMHKAWRLVAKDDTATQEGLLHSRRNIFGQASATAGGGAGQQGRRILAQQNVVVVRNVYMPCHGHSPN